MPVEKSVLTVWVLSFLTLLAILVDFSIVGYWVSEGPEFVLRPYLIGDAINMYIGGGSVFSYFCISVAVTSILLLLTCFVLIEKPADMTTIKMLGEVQVSQGHTQETMLQKIQELDQSYTTIEEEITRNHGNLSLELKKIRTNLKDAQKETLDLLAKKNEKTQRNMASAVETNLNKIRKEMLGKFDKQGEKMRKLAGLRQGLAIIEKEKAELEVIRAKLEQLEEKLSPPRPILTSQDNIEKIKGIGPILSKKFKNFGIKNIGELVSTDPTIIHEKTNVSQNMTEHFQATAQLLMIPTVSEKDAEILLEAGINSRQDLSEQNLAQLSRKIGDISRTLTKENRISGEAPTIEEMSSWIRMAKYF